MKNELNKFKFCFKSRLFSRFINRKYHVLYDETNHHKFEYSVDNMGNHRVTVTYNIFHQNFG